MLITKEKRPDMPSRHAVTGLKFKRVRLSFPRNLAFCFVTWRPGGQPLCGFRPFSLGMFSVIWME